MIRKIARKILPAGSKRRIIIGRVKNLILHRVYGPHYRYKIWVKKYEPKTISRTLKNQDVKISIVVPAYNTPMKYIEQLVNSLIAQTYTNWQLYIADGSTNEKSRTTIATQAVRDTRIKYIEVGKNLGISGNTNIALSEARGDYIVFLDHDDVLAPWACNELVTSILQHPGGSIFYSDEDRMTDNGKTRLTPLFKPDWSPDLFLNVNYITHLFAIKKQLLDKLKNLHSEYDGSQDYDLALRALNYNPEIIHIPKILYHMRMAKGSTARSIDEKDYAHTAGKRAIQAYLKKRAINASVLDIPNQPTNYKIQYNLIGNPLVSIIIPFKDKVDLLKTCLISMEKSTYKNYELILISNNSKEKNTYDFLKLLTGRKNVQILHYDKPFNYSKLNNFGRKHAKGEILIFLNNDTKVISKNWIEELASVSQRSEIGAVGPLLLYPDKTVQHAGVILGLTGFAGHIFRGLKPNVFTIFLLPNWQRNYLAITGACLAIETKKFDKIKGFNEKFVMAGSDVVLGLDLYKAGYRNIYLPSVRLIHYESKSVGSYNKAPISDYTLSMGHYKPYLNYKDPYFNPNLSLESEVPELRINYE